MTRDDDFLALLDPVQQCTECVFGLKSANLHHDPQY
jgi:hypothetical protein